MLAKLYSFIIYISRKITEFKTERSFFFLLNLSFLNYYIILRMEFKNVLEEISENIIFCLNKRIKERLVQKGSIRIQLNLFKALKKRIQIDKISDYEFLKQNNIHTKRYFKNYSYNEILADTFEIKVHFLILFLFDKI